MKRATKGNWIKVEVGSSTYSRIGRSVYTGQVHSVLAEGFVLTSLLLEVGGKDDKYYTMPSGEKKVFSYNSNWETVIDIEEINRLAKKDR